MVKWGTKQKTRLQKKKGTPSPYGGVREDERSPDDQTQLSGEKRGGFNMKKGLTGQREREKEVSKRKTGE